jgi:hypothetical protein
VHVDVANGVGDRIEWECALRGTSHACLRVVDTGGANAGVWIVRGVYAGASPAFRAEATMTVDFLTF